MSAAVKVGVWMARWVWAGGRVECQALSRLGSLCSGLLITGACCRRLAAVPRTMPCILNAAAGGACAAACPQLMERRKGNEAYRKRDFQTALHHYERAQAVVDFVQVG